MHKIRNFVLRTIHTSPLLADLVYHTAQRAWKARYWFSHMGAKLRKVQPQEVFEYRQLTAASAVQTAVTNICNAKCVFCAYPKAIKSGALQTGVMPFETFKKAIDEWAAVNGDTLDLTPTVGDTLVDPGLIEKIRYAVHTAKIKSVMLTTNGILFNRNALYQQLIDSGVSRVYISTPGTGRELYKKIYGVDTYNEVMSGLKNLLEYNRSKGNPVYIGIRFRNAQTPGEILRSEDYQNVIAPYVCDQVQCNFTVDYDNWGGTITEEDVSGFMKLRKLPFKLDVPCVGLFGFVVQHDGNVRLCGCRFKTTDNDDMIVGNIKEQTLQQISEGERAWDIIEGFYHGKRPETCVGCTMYRPINQDWMKNRRAVGNQAPRPATLASPATQPYTPPVSNTTPG